MFCCFLFKWVSQQMLLNVLSCLFYWDIFIQVTLKRSSCFVRNCKLQQVPMFRRSKPFSILQNCSGNMFVGFVLMELLHWWHHLQALKNVQDLASEGKGTHCVIHRCALASRSLPTPLKNVLDSTTKIINHMKSVSLSICLWALQRHGIDTRCSSITHVCTLAIERKRAKPRFWNKRRNKVILRTESKQVLILH